MNKKHLYESIMRQVSINVKKVLNELNSSTYFNAADKQEQMLDDDDYILSHTPERLAHNQNRIEQFKKVGNIRKQEEIQLAKQKEEQAKQQKLHDETVQKYAGRQSDILHQRQLKSNGLDSASQCQEFIKYLNEFFNVEHDKIIKKLQDTYDWHSITLKYYGNIQNYLDDNYWDINDINDIVWNMFIGYIKVNAINQLNITNDNNIVISKMLKSNIPYENDINEFNTDDLSDNIVSFIKECMHVYADECEFKKINPYGFKFLGQTFKYKYALLINYDYHLKSRCDGFANTCSISSLDDDHDAPYLVMSTNKKALRDTYECINEDKYYKSYGYYTYDDDDIFMLDDAGIEYIKKEFEENPVDWNWENAERY